MHVTLHTVSSSSRSPGLHWKTGEIYVLFLSNVFSAGQSLGSLMVEDRRKRETLGPWVHLVMSPQACGNAEETLCALKRSSKFTRVNAALFFLKNMMYRFPAEIVILNNRSHFACGLFKAGVGSIFSGVLKQNFHDNLEAYCIVVWEKERKLDLCFFSQLRP